MKKPLAWLFGGLALALLGWWWYRKQTNVVITASAAQEKKDSDMTVTTGYVGNNITVTLPSP